MNGLTQRTIILCPLGRVVRLGAHGRLGGGLGLGRSSVAPRLALNHLRLLHHAQAAVVVGPLGRVVLQNGQPNYLPAQ